MNDNLCAVYVGIDVSKAQLDVAVGKDGEYWQASNDAMGIRKNVERLQAIQPVLIVVEFDRWVGGSADHRDVRSWIAICPGPPRTSTGLRPLYRAAGQDR